MSQERTVLVTGVAGNLGTRLLPLLSESPLPLARFEPLDLGREASCWPLIELLRETGATSVVHLAFILDPLCSGVLDVERMWQINVA